MPSTPSIYTNEQKEKVIELRKKGMSWSEIAEETKVSQRVAVARNVKKAAGKI